MRPPPSESRSQVATRTSLVAAAATCLIGVIVLGEWIWHIDGLNSVFGPITMKTNAAIGLLLCGIALASLGRFPILARLCACGAALIGTLTLFEHVTGLHLGIDERLFVEAQGAAATTSPNRFGMNAAIGLMLAGAAIWNLAAGTVSTARRAQIFAVVGLALGAVPTIGYLYGAQQLYGIARYTGIAPQTAIAFLVLNLGLLSARPMVGPVSAFLSEGPGGTMLRRLALPIVAIPLILGYMEITARSAGVIDRGLGMALYSVSVIVVFGLTVWATARDIERSDRARRRAALQRDQLIVREHQARKDAEGANHLKDQFLATLSHELRTPLNVMLGSMRQLQEGVHADDHVRIVSRVARNGQLLARLVEDLLDLSRVSSGQFDIHMAPVDLNTVVRNAVDGATATASAGGVRLTISLVDLPPIAADAQRLQQIVSNLLSNAVKFTPTGGQVALATGGTAEATTLTIVDSGRGFDGEFAGELFKPFRQADGSPRREHGGLGLGLSIARHLAELHGGTLTGSSDGIGRGATFTLTIPRQAQTSDRVRGSRVQAGIAGWEPDWPT